MSQCVRLDHSSSKPGTGERLARISRTHFGTLELLRTFAESENGVVTIHFAFSFEAGVLTPAWPYDTASSWNLI